MVVVYLGHGELEETHGGLRLCGDGVALQVICILLIGKELIILLLIICLE